MTGSDRQQRALVATGETGSASDGREPPATAGHALDEAKRAARRARPGQHVPDTEPAAYAGFITRIIAFVLDAALINVVAVLVAAAVALVLSVLPTSHTLNTVLAAAGGVAFVAWVIGYFVTFWTTTGATPGNRVMRIRVIRADGSRLRPRHALARVAGIVLGLPLLWGYVPIFLNNQRRGLQDFMAGTVVVESPEARSGERSTR
jgi:uncharacterized RDD family membrane protein YckC